MKAKRFWICAAVALVAAGPAGGFLLGILNPGDPDPNPIGRVVYACLMAVKTPLHAGFPPRDGAGAGVSFNAWPHMLFAYVLIQGWLIYREGRSSIDRKNQPA